MLKLGPKSPYIHTRMCRYQMHKNTPQLRYEPATPTLTVVIPSSLVAVTQTLQQFLLLLQLNNNNVMLHGR